MNNWLAVAFIGMFVIAYLTRCARQTGAAIGSYAEHHEEKEFYARRKWEVKVD